MGESGKRLAINLAARIKQSYAIYDWPYSIRCLHFYFFFFFLAQLIYLRILVAKENLSKK